MEWLSTFDIYLLIASTMIAVGAAAHSWITSRTSASQGIIDDMNDRLNMTNNDLKIVKADIIRLDEKIKAMNLHSEIDVVHKRVTEMGQLVSKQSGQLQQINQSLHLIHEHMLNRPVGSSK